MSTGKGILLGIIGAVIGYIIAPKDISPTLHHNPMYIWVGFLIGLIIGFMWKD